MAGSRARVQTLTVGGQYTTVTLSADVTETAGVAADVTEFSFTPLAGAVYHYEVFGVFTAASNAIGLGVTFEPNNNTGVSWLTARGASDTAQVQRIGVIGGTVQGTSSSTAAETPFMGWGIVTGHASAPQVVRMRILSETAGNAVTIKAGKCFLRYRRLS